MGLPILAVLALILSLQAFGFAGEVLVTVDPPIPTYSARVQKNPIYQLQNKASMAYGEKAVVGTEYEKICLLSHARP